MEHLVLPSTQLRILYVFKCFYISFNPNNLKRRTIIIPILQLKKLRVNNPVTQWSAELSHSLQLRGWPSLTLYILHSLFKSVLAQILSSRKTSNIQMTEFWHSPRNPRLDQIFKSISSHCCISNNRVIAIFQKESEDLINCVPQLLSASVPLVISVFCLPPVCLKHPIIVRSPTEETEQCCQ